jgi:predicted  nucleic acid-binding Zn-ribbon protein
MKAATLEPLKPVAEMKRTATARARLEAIQRERAAVVSALNAHRAALAPVQTDRETSLEELIRAKIEAPDLEKKNLQLQLDERAAQTEVDEAREADTTALREQAAARLRPLVAQMHKALQQAQRLNREISTLESDVYAFAGGYLDPVSCAWLLDSDPLRESWFDVWSASAKNRGLLVE